MALDEVCDFWLEDCTPAEWYNGTEQLDAQIRDRFGALWKEARAGGLRDWQVTARGSLAYLILTDQFPRNMFRGSARAFATDRMALAVAKGALRKGFDLEIEGAARQFFYLPLEHSETTPDQHRAVRLIATRLASPDTLLHARVHREVIRQFGRFPYRNAALGRQSSSAEAKMLESGGYGAVLRRLQDAA